MITFGEGLNKEKGPSVAEQAKQRAKEIAAGIKRMPQVQQARGDSFMPEKITSVAEAGPQEVQNILQQREQMLQGFNAPQLAAMQAQLAQGQQAAQQQRDRSLQATLAKQGIRGGAAASLQAQAAQQAARDKGTVDQQMLLAQAQQQDRALGDYTKAVEGSLGLAQNQAFMESATKLALEQLAQAEKIAEDQNTAIKNYGTSMAEAQGKIICTELHRQGLMDSATYEADQQFGRELANRDPEVMLGYHAWAFPIVGMMKKSSVFSRIVGAIAAPWARQMAFLVGKRETPDYAGAFLFSIGIPFCRFVAKIKKTLARVTQAA